MGQIIKVPGPPGTGKTTFISQSVVVPLVRAGTNPKDIAICSLTKAAANRSRQSVVSATGKDPEEFEWVGTMHSFCFALLGARSDDKVSDEQLKPFFEDLHVSYDPPRRKRATGFDLYEDNDDEATDKGAWFLSFYDWFRSIRWEHGQPPPTNDDMIRDAVMDYPGGFRQFGGDRHAAMSVAAHCWQPYEELLTNLKLWDFPRLIAMAIDAEKRPPCRVLVVDEAQDLSPILWHLARQWADKATTSWFAGDPYQAIYTFAGAHPGLFQRLTAIEHRLIKNYRFGKTRIDLALGILRNDPDYEAFEWIGVERDDAEGYTDGTIASLLRTRSLVRQKASEYRREGIPYASNRAPTLVRSKAAFAVHAGLQLEAEGSMSLGDLKRFTDSVPVKGWLRRGFARDKINSVFLEEGPNARIKSGDLEQLGLLPVLRKLLEDGNPWPAIKKLDDDTRRDLGRMIERFGRDALVTIPKLFTTTIHGAKGLEFDAVESNLTWPTLPYQNYQGTGRGEESRVGYVHVTRARHSQSFDYLGGNCFPPLARFR